MTRYLSVILSRDLFTERKKTASTGELPLLGIMLAALRHIQDSTSELSTLKPFGKPRKIRRPPEGSIEIEQWPLSTLKQLRVRTSTYNYDLLCSRAPSVKGLWIRATKSDTKKNSKHRLAFISPKLRFRVCCRERKLIGG